jgi:hypothetical protein
LVLEFALDDLALPEHLYDQGARFGTRGYML